MSELSYKTGTDIASFIPSGPLERKWADYCSSLPLVAPGRRRLFKIIVVGTGLAGSSAAAALGELGYNLEVFCIQDSPRRAHSVAAQGGINAAKNYANDGDSVKRLFYDTIRGGDFRAREANVYRLAELSGRVIDHCVALGVPFAREYGGHLSPRSFGGTQLSRTFYARGQTGQQLLLAAFSSMMRQVKLGTVNLHPRCEMLDLVVANGRACGIVYRDLVSGRIASELGDAVLLATGGYAGVFGASTNALSSSVKGALRCWKRGAYFANPCFTQIHPTCLPQEYEHQSKLTLMSESLRNDGRIWVPVLKGDTRSPADIPEAERDYFLERLYPSYGNLVPRDIASRAVSRICGEGRGVSRLGNAVYLDLSDAVKRLGREAIDERYGNLLEMYQHITSIDAHCEPMRIYPAPHYTMGGLWVDYSLMTSVPGLFALGEANFSDHGANRLGASALMQGLCDGYFIIPYTLAAYLARNGRADAGEAKENASVIEKQAAAEIEEILSVKGSAAPVRLRSRLGKVMTGKAGMSRTSAGLKQAAEEIADISQEFSRNICVRGSSAELNHHLEEALRLKDSIEASRLVVLDALHREESCGGHFREEYQTERGEALRRDEVFSYAAAWEYSDDGLILHKEHLQFSDVRLIERDYR